MGTTSTVTVTKSGDIARDGESHHHMRRKELHDRQQWKLLDAERIRHHVHPGDMPVARMASDDSL
jgi:hypothetical protein